jgi:hypothetical protein
MGTKLRSKGKYKKTEGWQASLEDNGGARRDRTADLYNAIVALSQLSYGPIDKV